MFRLPWLPDVAVISRLAPLTVGIELFIKHSVSGRGAFLGARVGSLADRRRGRGDQRFFRRRSRRGRFSIRERFFTCLEIGLVLREKLLFRIDSFGRKTVLNLTLDLGLSFFFGLLFLTGNKKCQGRDQWENGELLHGVVRQEDGLLIRMNCLQAEMTGPANQSLGEGDADGANETGMTVIFSI